MIVTAWKNQSFKTAKDISYGIKMKLVDRDRYFKKDWKSIILSADNETIVCLLAPSFWKKCTELRHAKIGKWLVKNKYIPWNKSHPPKLILEPLAEGKFLLKSK